ncbi:MAG TPA: HAD-IA family hydrolase [Acetobacteraceae bacterium]|nr:HAD-IA family hydrolase [Acetobacteraceae bacterium]
MAAPMLVIFDCDGVLVDSEAFVGRIHAEALAAAGFPLTEAEIARRFTGHTDAEMYAAIEADAGRPVPPGYHEGVKAAIERAYRRDLRAIPGVEAAIDAAPGPVCVASSSAPSKLRLGLAVTGLLPRFDPHVFSAAEVARGKPAPDLFLHAAARMGAAPGDCLVIEDSLAGVAAARAAGMRIVGFSGGSHCGPGHADRLATAGAERVFSAMADLADVLRAGAPA